MCLKKDYLPDCCTTISFVAIEGLLIYFLPVEENKLITLQGSVRYSTNTLHTDDTDEKRIYST